MPTTVSAKVNAASLESALKNQARFRLFNPSRPHGSFLLSYSRTLTAAEVGDFNASGDFLEFFTFPANTYLSSAKVTVPDMDTHATPLITLDLLLDATVLVNDSTAGQAGGTIEYSRAGLLDASAGLLKLKIETVASTIPTSYGAFTVLVEVYKGAPGTV